MNMTEIEPIALFDMDGTLCDYDQSLLNALAPLRGPNEPEVTSLRDAPDYVRKRADIIRASELWWQNLPRFQLGWDVLDVAKDLEFNIMILTQGPRRNPASWAGKKRWIDDNLGPDTDVTITRDKGIVYGKVLVDDFPGYIERWLSWRDRGLVIMPTNESNQGFSHPQVIRYDGKNLEHVQRTMQIARDRKRGEPLKLP